MASWLVLDWDHDQFRVLCAQSTRRGIQVTRAATWPHSEPLTAASAERVGKALRDFLKAEKIPAAPAVIGLGRDRIFLKELRFPPVAPHEEANLVRFQTGKEMSEPVDNYSIDYAHLYDSSTERHVMTVAVRKEIVATVAKLCQAAGLKMHAITPKLFGVRHVLPRSLDPDPSPLEPKRLNAVLMLGKRWAELTFFNGDRLVQAQALANSPMLPAEVKRSLAVFAAQNATNVDLTGPDLLYLYADDATMAQDLDAGQPLSLSEPDPLKPEPTVASTVPSPMPFAGAVGLAGLWSDTGQRPVNLAAPKRAAAPSSAAKRGALIYGTAAAVGLILMIGGMGYALHHRNAKVAALIEERDRHKAVLAKNAQERADLDAYKEWEQTTVPWLDELYDLTARYPFKEGFRVNQLQAETSGTAVAGAKKGKDAGGVGRINLSGIYPRDADADYVNLLYSALQRDAHLRPGLGPSTGSAAGIAYKMKIDIKKQDASKYNTQLIVPPAPRSAAPTLSPAEKKNAEPIPPGPETKKIMPSDPADDDPDGGPQ